MVNFPCELRKSHAERILLIQNPANPVIIHTQKKTSASHLITIEVTQAGLRILVQIDFRYKT